MEKVLVLYVFHIYNSRVEYFIKNALFFDESVDFIMISNDRNNTFEVPSYVKILFRDNIGYDFGGWSEAVLTNDVYKKYDKFVFVNSSTIGPLVPTYFKGKWTDIYLDELKNNVKLFGSTINTMCDPMNRTHVQSYIFCMDKNTLEFLITKEIFSVTNIAHTHDEAIFQKEILMSRKIIENGWNIGSLLELYKNVDFTFSNKTPADYQIPWATLVCNDIMCPPYRNNIWTDAQIVFIKGNRFL
jgi:hypothetical protein